MRTTTSPLRPAHYRRTTPPPQPLRLQPLRGGGAGGGGIEAIMVPTSVLRHTPPLIIIRGILAAKGLGSRQGESGEREETLLASAGPAQTPRKRPPPAKRGVCACAEPPRLRAASRAALWWLPPPVGRRTERQSGPAPALKTIKFGKFGKFGQIPQRTQTGKEGEGGRKKIRFRQCHI